MTTPKKGALTVTITGGMIAAALVWSGSVNAKIEQVQGVYKSLDDINKRLSRIEGALGVKNKSDEKEE